jgi:cobalt/nickel transport system permease protein
MVGSLFIRSYERSERVYSAMLARGFDGTFRTTDLARLDPRRLLPFAIVLAAIVLFTLAANLWAPR